MQAKGRGWPVALGRRDSTTTAVKAASAFLPTPDLSFYELVENFKRVNFTIDEMITLSGTCSPKLIPLTHFALWITSILFTVHGFVYDKRRY